ncbi:MAG: hypothetical protein CMM46_13960 [Rhodospirillaceae bacterium]|nr:hypothetical protein [Rhodospirillaceae bacterium]|tara:strand:+ start:3300 stop:4124 length:825 start_codon:yes stop_codon:yes gene_type:complete
MIRGNALRFAFRVGFGMFLVGSCAAVAWYDYSQALVLGHPEIETGWLLLASIVFLALYNIRKKLSMLPLGRSSYWLVVHVVVGIGVIIVYALHARTLWPSGYELLLALLFYAVVLSGIAGYILQRVLSTALTKIQNEFIWERIPGDLYELRRQAEEIIMECAEKTGSEVLPRLYRENLHWYFRKPRFAISSLFVANTANFWLRHHIDSVSIYLQGEEHDYCSRLQALAYLKIDLDRSYTLQRLLKVWLLVHVPATYAFLVLVIWHVILVHVYLV